MLKNILNIFFIAILFFTINSSSQDRRLNKEDRRAFPPPLFLDVFSFNVDNSNKLFIAYRIPFSNLIFESNGSNYEAGFEIFVELKNKITDELKRESKLQKVETNSFDETNSENDFLEGFLEFNVVNGDYELFTFIEDKLAKKQRPLRPFFISLKDSSEFFKPLLISIDSVTCDENINYRFENFSGKIPFSERSFDLLVSFKDSEFDELFIEIKKDEKIFYEETIKNFFIGLPLLKNCKEKLFIHTDSSENNHFFIIPKVNTYLDEGIYSLEIKDEKRNLLSKAELNIEWLFKPFSLHDLDEALDIVAIIDDENRIKKLNDEFDDSKDVLNEFWKPYDPTPDSKYNEVMSEFYRRVDFADFNYQSISNRRGSLTDRGKIYIKNGLPDKIERGVNGNGKITESWFYNQPNRHFVFVDYKGDGSFSLMKN